MKIIPNIDGSDRYQGETYRVHRGEVADLPAGLANAYLTAKKARKATKQDEKSDGPNEAAVVAPEADTSDHPDEHAPEDSADETPTDLPDEDKADDGVIELGGGWYRLPDGTKQRGRP